MNAARFETNKPPLENIENGTDNRSYTRSLTDIPIATPDKNRKLDVIIPVRATSASAAPFPIIFEVIDDEKPPVKSTSARPSIQSPDSNYYSHPRRSSGSKTFERQLSQLDPKSDRVSTILVWQNLTVQIRPDKRKEVIQRVKSYKTFVPQRKCLLNNISGSIAGGLWAVMGKLISIPNDTGIYLCIHRSFGFG